MLSLVVRNFFVLLTFLLLGQCLVAQASFIIPSDTLNTKRLRTAAIFAGSTYSALSIGLYGAWYRQFDQTSFHFFDDWNEWNNMDKMGHFYSAYSQGLVGYRVARWTGLSERNALWSGVVIGSLVQTTIEVMDGFSEKWGFSVYDAGYNVLGIGALVGQQYYWNEQRIQFKVSGYSRPYDATMFMATSGGGVSSLDLRADALFGRSFAERFLKDYNTQTLWASINVYSFLAEDSRFPKWLNLVLGTGSENMFGGFENRWQEGNSSFSLSDNMYPRYRQFYIGLDVDLTRLPISNYYWKSLLAFLNIVKLPGPAIEINTLGEVKFHLIHF